MKLFDEGGLFLLVTSNGGKWWRFRYLFEGREKLLSLGTYPDTPLGKARDKRDAARRLLADGIDPSAHRKATKAAKSDENSFEGVAREWHVKQRRKWTEDHANRILRRLEADVFPWLGRKPVGQVTAPELLTVLRRIEARGVIE
ncbi:MAG: tyrosine-type recombinase/integrase, partial [Burkholderiales bacterium]